MELAVYWVIANILVEYTLNLQCSDSTDMHDMGYTS